MSPPPQSVLIGVSQCVQTLDGQWKKLETSSFKMFLNF